MIAGGQLHAPHTIEAPRQRGQTLSGAFGAGRQEEAVIPSRHRLVELEVGAEWYVHDQITSTPGQCSAVLELYSAQAFNQGHQILVWASPSAGTSVVCHRVLITGM